MIKKIMEEIKKGFINHIGGLEIKEIDKNNFLSISLISKPPIWFRN